MPLFDPIKPIHYWIQKVMPLVYDDSLSVYELLNKVCEKLNEVINVVNPLGEGIDGYLNQFKEEFEQEIQVTLTEFQSEVNKQINDNNQAINNRLNSFQTEIAGIKTYVDSEVAKIDPKIEAATAEIEKTVTAQILLISQQIKDTDEANRVWTIAQINAKFAEMPDEWPPVVDPSDGLTESVQTALNHMWDSWRGEALTADEYDALNLTATAYDNHNLTANQYDRAGKILLVPSNTVMVNGLPLKASAIDMEVLTSERY